MPGKTYQAFLSQDLSAWVPASDNFLGSGVAMTYQSEPLHSDGTVPDKIFWRIETGDTDSDGDTLTDYDEHRRNLDPFSTDTDKDGIPDNLDPQPLINALQATWDADNTNPAGTAALFASFNFTPATGTYPLTVEKVTDLSGNNRHGKARSQSGSLPPPQNAPMDNAEGIARQGFHCAATHHFAFDLKNPGINFAPIATLSFWLKTNTAALSGNGQPIFSYIPKEAISGQTGNTANPNAARAYLRKQQNTDSYEIIWLDWQHPVNQVRERWELDLHPGQINNNWINITFVWQGTGSGENSNWACYANGIKQHRTHNSTRRFQTTATTANTPQDTFLIGADAAAGSGTNNQPNISATFQGTFDRIRIYTTTLTPAQILAITAQDTDNDGLWDATEVNTTTWGDTNANGKRDPGEIHHLYVNPLQWQPLDTDTDSDELTDIQEQNITRTLLQYFDTDQDLLPDGWEHSYGLNPHSAIGPDGRAGDPDGDNVDNFDEWRYLSRPKAAPGQPNSTATDSDGDGTPDRTEIDQGTHPAYPPEQGQAAPEPDPFKLKIIIGDPSGSHSERWALKATEVTTGQEILRHGSHEYGQMSSEAESIFTQFKPHTAYTFQLYHHGTDPIKRATDPYGDEYPDYDWSLQISYQHPGGEWINISNPQQTEYLVTDPYDTRLKKISTLIPPLLATTSNFATIGMGSNATTKYFSDLFPCRVIMLPIGLATDANRDGKIDQADRELNTPETPWRFWTNDDDDGGDAGGSDIPQTPASKETNGYDQNINGLRDLVDFFPLHLDLQAHLKIYPEGKYDYQLSHPASMFAPCFRIAYAPTLLPADSDAYLKDIETGNSVQYLQSLPIHSTGRNLTHTFLRQLEQGTGMLLIEAIRPTTEPITLKIINQTTGNTVAETQFHVSVSSVRDMYRWKYLVEGTAGSAQGEIAPNPPNWPDAETNGKQFIFVHGYNVTSEQSLGWCGEMFKRMFWSGSNAMFSGVSWNGYESRPFYLESTPDFWRNVENAFQVSKSVASHVTALPGGSEKYIAAHSLGNVVVGSAIKDHGLSVSKFFMIDAAAAIEAFSPTSQQGTDKMSHPDWRPYEQRFWCSEWHKIFPEEDNRSKMTWRGRFEGLANAYNFYSSGEEVLKNGTGDVPSAAGVASSGGVRGWVTSEMTKGFSFLVGGGLFHNGTGGWDWNPHWDITESDGYGGQTTRTRTPAETTTITDEGLEENPFFDPFVNQNFHDPNLGSAEAEKYNEVAKALAESIPVLTFAAGSNPIDIFESSDPLGESRNYDMMALKNGWLNNRTVADGVDKDDWLHSDIRGIAYLYTHKVYEKFIELGELDDHE